MSIILGSNNITIDGYISEEPSYSHTAGMEKFYKFVFTSERYSGVNDVLNCIISERLLKEVEIKPYAYCVMDGSVRSRNIDIGNERKCELYIFVSNIEKIDAVTHTNNVEIQSGFVVKQSEFRRTPLGREVIDFVVAVNRPNKKADYIPCIAWGRNAKYLARKDRIGQKVNLYGRFQSRDYVKRFEDGSEENRTAYELSVSTLDIVKEVVAENDNENKEDAV